MILGGVALLAIVVGLAVAAKFGVVALIGAVARALPCILAAVGCFVSSYGVRLAVGAARDLRAIRGQLEKAETDKA